VLDDQCFDIGMERDFLKQRQECRLEFGTIFLALELIAGEMDRQTTPRRLSIQPGKTQVTLTQFRRVADDLNKAPEGLLGPNMCFTTLSSLDLQKSFTMS